MGNIDAKEIGDTKDYVYGMWLMLQQDKPDDLYWLQINNLVLDCLLKKLALDLKLNEKV